MNLETKAFTEKATTARNRREVTLDSGPNGIEEPANYAAGGDITARYDQVALHLLRVATRKIVGCIPRVAGEEPEIVAVLQERRRGR